MRNNLRKYWSLYPVIIDAVRTEINLAARSYLSSLKEKTIPINLTFGHWAIRLVFLAAQIAASI
jgi:hypothetical protein